MGGADVGGDGSVKWKVWGDNVRPGKEKVNNKGTHGREHQHVDETDETNPGNFRISIELPGNQADTDALVNTLKNIPSVPGSRVNFELPIVQEHYEQIQIRWDSLPPSPGHHAMTSLAAMKAGGAKKKMAKKSSKKTSKKTSKKASKKKSSTKKKK